MKLLVLFVMLHTPLDECEVLRKALMSECGDCTFEEMMWVGSCLLNRIGYINKWGNMEFGETLWSIVSDLNQMSGFQTEGWNEYYVTESGEIVYVYNEQANHAAELLLQNGTIHPNVLFYYKKNEDNKDSDFVKWGETQPYYKPESFEHKILITQNY